MKVQELIRHILEPVLQHPSEIQFNVIEGSQVMIVELQVHDDDVHILTDNDSSILQSIKQLLTVSAGELKPSLELLNIAT